MSVGCRLKTKKDLKACIGKHVYDGHVRLLETSMFENEIVENGRFSVVGPDPYLNRRWYGTIAVENGIIVRIS